MYDFHSHSNYSDGEILWRMVRAAQEAGLDGVGITDHCMLPEHERLRDDRAALGHTLDQTYERRRRGIETVRAETDIEIYDAVEMDYDPDAEGRIADFLNDADFEYVIGSVHALDDRPIQYPPDFADETDRTLDALVDQYFDELVGMIDSELFDIAAHPDLVERTPHLSGRATDHHYERVAKALADSRTVPEINAGRALRDDGMVHPNPDFLDVLVDHDLQFTLGTDAHHPDEYEPRAAFLADFADEHGLDVTAPPSL